MICPLDPVPSKLIKLITYNPEPVALWETVRQFLIANVKYLKLFTKQKQNYLF